MKRTRARDQEEIENLVRSRPGIAARRAIQQWLREKSDSSAVFMACDWYRRLGLYPDAYRALSRLKVKARAVAVQSTDTTPGLQLLWAARILNLLGASSLARSVLPRIAVRTAEEHRIVANIYLSNFEYARALRHFEAMEATGRDPGDYSFRIGLIGLTDCLAGLNRFDEAIRRVREFKKSAHPERDRLFYGICLQAEGEYLARAGRFDPALRILADAVTYYPTGDRSPDYAFLCKWLGYCQFRTGDSDRGLRNLETAEAILREPRFRPEMRLDLWRLKAEAGLLSSVQGKILSHYPGAPPGFLNLLEARSGPARFGSPGARLKIHLDSDEFERGKSRYWGIPRELRLLAWIKVSQGFGLSLTRAKSLLWPEEPFSYLQMEDRLAQLLRRLRNRYGIDCPVTDGNLGLAREHAERVAVFFSGHAAPRFLVGATSFKALDVSLYYDVSITQRSHYLQLWQEQGWVKAEGIARARRYRVG